MVNQTPGSVNYLTQILDGVYNATDPRAYPLSSYSYMLIPTGKSDRRMNTAKRQTLADFMYFSLCEGQSNAGPYGYSPLPLNLVQAGFEQLGKLKQADNAVDLTNRDVTKCHNPTFVSGNLKANHLAQIAPQPASCDKTGAGPCGLATGTGVPTPDTHPAGVPTGGTGTAAPTSAGGASAAAGTGGATAGTAGGGSSGSPGTPGAAAGGAVGTTVDPETGAVVSAPTDASGTAVAGSAVSATPTELVASRTGDSSAFGGLAVLEILLLVLVPGLYVAYLRRRPQGR